MRPTGRPDHDGLRVGEGSPSRSSRSGRQRLVGDAPARARPPRAPVERAGPPAKAQRGAPDGAEDGALAAARPTEDDAVGERVESLGRRTRRRRLTMEARCTSPASSAVHVRRRARRAGALVVDAGAASPAARPAHAPADEGVALAQRGERSPASSAQARLERASSAGSVGSSCVGREAERRRRRAHLGAAARRSTATLTPIPSTAQRSRGRPSTRIAGDLAAVDEHVVGPLHARGRARDVRDREAGAQREQRVGASRTTSDSSSARPGGARPAAALAPAPGGLLAGRHERAVRRARLGQRRAPARSSSPSPEVQPRAPERHRALTRSSSPGRRAERGGGVARG